MTTAVPVEHAVEPAADNPAVVAGKMNNLVAQVAEAMVQDMLASAALLACKHWTQAAGLAVPAHPRKHCHHKRRIPCHHQNPIQVLVQAAGLIVADAADGEALVLTPPCLIRSHAVVVQSCVDVNQLTQGGTVVVMNFYSVMP